MSAKIRITTQLDLKLDEVLLDSELEVLESLGEQAVNEARQIWTGWKYGEHYPEEQRGTSGESWSFNLTEPDGRGGFVRGVNITNDATIQSRGGTYTPKFWGRPASFTKPYSNKQVGEYYAAYVTRSGSSVPESEVVFNKIKNDLVPIAERALRDAIERNAGRNRVTETFVVNNPSDTTDHFDILSETLI